MQLLVRQMNSKSLHAEGSRGGKGAPKCFNRRGDKILQQVQVARDIGLNLS
jgi:hypothetical protein